MTYQVLARKWRPRDFGSLVGQEHVVRALRHALESNRLHHAYLFTGTRGVGKTTLARILAKCLNCETGVGPQPCGTCSACLEIDSGRFVDLLEVDAATNTKVDEMRQLLETAQYSPTRGRFKVYVIDEVHMLSNSAFNAMLKTLEEPPAHLKFILATTDPQKIPVTVLSRCLQFNLKQMPPAAIVGHLVDVLEKEGVSYERDALAMLSRAAGGSMRDSLSLLDQAIAHGEGSVTTGMVTDMLGTIDQGYLLRVLEAVASGDAKAAIAVVDEMQGRSVSFDSALADLSGVLLRVAMAQAVPDALERDVPQREAILDLAAKLDPELVQLFYQMAIQGRQDLPLAPDEHGGFLMTVLRMLAFREEGGGLAQSPSKPAARTATGGGVPPGGRTVRQPSPAPETSPSMSPPAGGPAFGASADEWAKLCQEIQVAGAARELARNAELRGRSGDVFELVVPKAKAYLAERIYVDKLKSALQGRLGAGVSVRVSVGDTAGASPADVEAGERQVRQAEVRQSVRTDGFVNDLINLFDGKVVDSTIRENEK